MRRMLSIGITALFIIGLAQAAVDERAALARFQQDYPAAGFYRNGDCIARVYGPAFSVGVSPADSAATFVARYSEMLGVAATDLVPGNHFNDRVTQPVMYDRESDDFKFTLVYFQQSRDGVPVYQRDLRLLHRNEENYPLVLAACNLVNLGNFFVPVGATEMDPGEIGHAQAVAAVANLAEAGLDGQYVVDVPGPVNFGPSTYVVWAGVEQQRVEPRLAVTFIADNGLVGTSEVGRWEFVADAFTGEILHVRSLVIFEDVVGNVSGMSTPGHKADHCTDEVVMPMSYGRVNVVGGNTVDADVDGDFVIPHGGSSQVTVRSRLRGTYFNVDTTTELLKQVIPPGPVYFMHNEPNTSEFLRAEVNGYIHSNIVRDFTLAQNPYYPTIWNETNFPVKVNLTGGYCPGNAWYDYSSINFCRAGSGFANTAFSVVVYHEYGHHMVDRGGSGQGAYGEGMSDSVAVLITDESKLAPGFYLNDCVNGIRDADNNIQYPCSGGIHYCGQLLSGCIWSTRNELIITHPDTYLDILSNLAVNSILLHSGTSINPSITIDFLTLDDNDGNIYNGTPHAIQICAGFGAHNMDCPPEIEFAPIGFAYPEGRPDMVAPGVPTTFPVNVVAMIGEPVSGSAQIHYSLDGGAWVTDDMDEIEPHHYVATLPTAHCDSSYRWYISAQAVDYGTVTDPWDAPTDTYYAPVATGTVVLFFDNFDTDKGWHVYAGADIGNWERAEPEQVTTWGGVITQPGKYDIPSPTYCYVTGPLAGSGAGSYDVDGGPTILTSPALDMPTGGIISYWRWYHISTVWDDEFVIQVSNNDGATWVTVEVIDDRETWTYVEWRVEDYVTPSSQVRVRFIADDTPNNSLVEALIDDFMAVTLECIEPDYPLGDLNCDYVVDGFDIQPFVLALTDPDAYASQYPNCNYMLADINGDGVVDGFDIQPFVELLIGS